MRFRASPVAQMVKNPPAMQETQGQSLGREDPLENFPCSSVGKESACNAEDPGSIPGLGRYPGEGNGYPVFLPGDFHGQRSLVGYSPWSLKELDMTE